MRSRATLRVGRTPEAVTAAASGDIVGKLREVARAHAPESGYGDTAWNPSTSTVYWVPADWTSTDEVDAAHAAFLDLDEVRAVEGEAEAALPNGDDWQHVWPEPSSQEAVDRVMELARRPLDVFAGIPASAHYRPAEDEDHKCATCGSYVAGNCTMFAGDPPVSADFVCDEWNDAREGVDDNSDS